VAFLTAKDVGKAVARNRLRRRLREALRALWTRVADEPVDLLLMGLPRAAECDFRVLAQSVQTALRKAGALRAGDGEGAGAGP
jgi:ribonuclease P protein component